MFDILSTIHLYGIVDNDGKVLYYEANKFSIEKKVSSSFIVFMLIVNCFRLILVEDVCLR